MELRRKELLSDENGYWRQRMILDQRLSGMGLEALSSGGAGGEWGSAEASASPGDASEDPDRAVSTSPQVGAGEAAGRGDAVGLGLGGGVAGACGGVG